MTHCRSFRAFSFTLSSVFVLVFMYAHGISLSHPTFPHPLSPVLYSACRSFFCMTAGILFGLEPAPKYLLRMELRHEAIYFLSAHHLHRTDDRMALRGFFRRLKNRRRKRSRARSETGSIEEPSEVEPVVPRHTESTPDLCVDALTSASGPSTSRDPYFNGM